MCMNKFPLAGFILKACIAATLTGCASKSFHLMPVADSQSSDLTDKKNSTGQMVKKCEATQRDLTIPWARRQYWCGNEKRQEGLQDINNRSQVNSKQNQLALNESYLDVINEEVNRAQYDVPDLDLDSDKSTTNEKAVPVLDRDETLKRLKGLNGSEAKSNDSVPTPQVIAKKIVLVGTNISTKSNSKTKSSIYFAPNIRVLGPQGRESTHELIDQVIVAEKVLLRGLILPNEILVDSALYREKVSVGRALAVREYWQGQGVNTSHITILHHDPELNGRTVEVAFHG
jgi:hypothetical protein